jgi:hypothetical protein
MHMGTFLTKVSSSAWKLNGPDNADIVTGHAFESSCDPSFGFGQLGPPVQCGKHIARTGSTPREIWKQMEGSCDKANVGWHVRVTESLCFWLPRSALECGGQGGIEPPPPAFSGILINSLQTTFYENTRLTR